MNLNVTKEWCLKMAKMEDDAPIGAGVPDGGAYYAKPSLRTRIWQKFGFCFHDSAFEWRTQEPKEGDWWVPGTLNTDVTITVDWLDRLRLLVTGHCKLLTYTRTDVLVNKSEARSTFTVLPPA